MTPVEGLDLGTDVVYNLSSQLGGRPRHYSCYCLIESVCLLGAELFDNGVFEVLVSLGAGVRLLLDEVGLEVVV